MEPPDQLKVMAATSLVISTHFSLAEEYLDAAGLQNGRIWLDPPPEWDPGNWVELTRELSDAAAMMAPGDSIPMPHFDYGNIAERQSRFQAILIEVHLYFVLIDHVYKYLDAVVSADRYHELRVRLDELNDKWFRNYNAGRNLFEHRISRLVALGESGQPWHHELSLDHGYLLHTDPAHKRDHFWDIRKEAFAGLRHDVEDLLRQVVERSGSWPSLGTAPQ